MLVSVEQSVAEIDGTTVSGCDGDLIRTTNAVVRVNSVLAAGRWLWLTVRVKISVGDASGSSLLESIMVWNEPSLLALPQVNTDYRLDLDVDGEVVDTQLTDGSGGGLDDETGTLHWRQRLLFEYGSGDVRATLRLDWPSAGLRGDHVIDLATVRAALRSAAGG